MSVFSTQFDSLLQNETEEMRTSGGRKTYLREGSNTLIKN